MATLPPVTVPLGVSGVDQAVDDLKKFAKETEKAEKKATDAATKGAKARGDASKKSSKTRKSQAEKDADAEIKAQEKVTKAAQRESNKRIANARKEAAAKVKAQSAEFNKSVASGLSMAGGLAAAGAAALGGATIGLGAIAANNDQRARRIAAKNRASFGDKSLRSVDVYEAGRFIANRTGSTVDETFTALENVSRFSKDFDEQQRLAQASLEVSRVTGREIGETSTMLGKAGKTFGISDTEALRNAFLNANVEGLDEELLTFGKKSFGGGAEGLSKVLGVLNQLQETAGGPGEAKQKFIQLSERLSEKDFLEKLQKDSGGLINIKDKKGNLLGAEQQLENLLVATNGGDADLMKKMGLDADMQVVVEGLGKAYRETYEKTKKVDEALEAHRAANEVAASSAYTAAEANKAVAEATNDAEANWNRAVEEFKNIMSDPELIAAVGDTARAFTDLAPLVTDFALGIKLLAKQLGFEIGPSPSSRADQQLNNIAAAKDNADKAHMNLVAAEKTGNQDVIDKAQKAYDEALIRERYAETTAISGQGGALYSMGGMEAIGQRWMEDSVLPSFDKGLLPDLEKFAAGDTAAGEKLYEVATEKQKALLDEIAENRGNADVERASIDVEKGNEAMQRLNDATAKAIEGIQKLGEEAAKASESNPRKDGKPNSTR